MSFTDLLGGTDSAALEILGAAFVYTPGTGDPVEPLGIFDAAYRRVDAGTAGISSSGPAVFCRLDDLASDPREDGEATVTVDSVTYSIHEAQPDGLGGVLLHLHRTS